MSLRAMVRALVVALMASALVYAVIIFASDGPEVARALNGFSPWVLVTMLALSLACFVIRAVRWGMLMRLMGHRASLLDSIYLQLSGQTMAVSPGRVGEVLKPWLARESANMPMTEGVALIFAERVADLIAVAILSVYGLTAIGAELWALAAVVAIIVGAIAVASSKHFHKLAHKVASKSLPEKHQAALTGLSGTLGSSLSLRALSWSVPMSVVAWGLEGVGFALCMRELGFSGLEMSSAVSVYAVSTIAGALTFLPGGIGMTEASMAGILVAVGMNASAASATTLLTRVATLWWGVGLGWLCLLSRPAAFRRLLSQVALGAADN